MSVNWASTLAQPPGPHVSNFGLGQSIDPTQPFRLTWDAFAGGTSTDFISLQIDTNFVSANLGTSGALNGTATSVVIPANTLPPDTFLDGCYLTFCHFLAATNSAYATFAYRAHNGSYRGVRELGDTLALTPAISHPMGEGARRAGEGWLSGISRTAQQGFRPA